MSAVPAAVAGSNTTIVAELKRRLAAHCYSRMKSTCEIEEVAEAGLIPMPTLVQEAEAAMRRSVEEVAPLQMVKGMAKRCTRTGAEAVAVAHYCSSPYYPYYAPVQ